MSEGSSCPEEVMGTSEENFETIVVPTIEEPLGEILKQIKGRVEDEEYSLLAGDDTSGRLTTLVLKKVVDYINDRQGLPHLPTIFIQAGRNIDPEQVDRQIRDLKERYGKACEGKKLLLITDYVRSGGTMKRLADLFSSAQLDFDVATLDMDQSEETYREQGVFGPNTVVFSGNSGNEHKQPKIWGKPGMSGLAYDKDSEISRGRAVDGTETKIQGLAHKSTPTNRQFQREARKDVEIISQRLIQSLYPDA